MTTHVSLTFTDAPRAVLDAVLIECSAHRDHVGTWLGLGEPWAPQVSCSGSKDGAMLYKIVTPKFEIGAAASIATAATVTEGIRS